MRCLALAAVALSTATLGHPGVARADTCGPAGRIEYVLPIDGATEVHPDARIVVRYTLDAALAGETPVVEIEGPGGPVEVTTSWDGRAIVLGPLAPLARGTHYAATASRPGEAPWPWTFDTTTGDVPAVSPVLGPALAARAEYLGGGPEGDDPCGPIGLERYRVHLELPAAYGSSGPGNVEYVAFETRGRGITEPTEVARAVDETGGADVGFDFYLRADGVRGEACFRVLSVDVTGASSGTTEEACARLHEGPFFRSMCGVTGRPGQGASAVVIGALVLLACARERARARSRQGSTAPPRGATFRT